MMEISVAVGSDSISIAVEDPFHINLESIAGQIETFCFSKGAALSGVDIKGLLPRMTRGVAGCENGCPADAKELVHRGFKGFKLAYVEGGILTAKTVIAGDKELSIKMFPDFQGSASSLEIFEGANMNIVLATRNKKQVEEIKRIVRDMPVVLYTLDDFPGCPEVKEDGKTFEENAVKKARSVSDYTKMPVLADDSGLEVYALNGAPGVLSARYAGGDANDKRNYEKLLNEMKSVKSEDRGARFACCIALAFPDGKVETFTGYAEGRIGTEPRGANGFGYDPIFYSKGHQKTFAEMPDKDKDALSHRGKALGMFYDFLKSGL